MWPKCPKCKSDNVRIIEVWIAHTISWEPNSAADEGDMDMGHPKHVEGECISCGHRWKFRKIIQVQPEWWNAPAEGDGK